MAFRSLSTHDQSSTRSSFSPSLARRQGPKTPSNLLIFTRGTKSDVQRPARNERASTHEQKAIELSVVGEIACLVKTSEMVATISNFLTELLTRQRAAASNGQTEANLSVNSTAAGKEKRRRVDEREGGTE